MVVNRQRVSERAPVSDATGEDGGANQPRGGGGTWSWETVRAFGVVFGGPLVLDVAGTAALTATVRAVKDRRRPSALAALGSAAVVLHAVKLRPWMEHWGVEGDDGPAHAIEIDAPRRDVWPWLAQIGQDRGGFYSYEWLENLAGCQMHNADTVHREWQHREVGEDVMLHPDLGLPVTRFDPGHGLALQGWGSFELEPLPGDRTRLIARGDPPSNRAAAAFYALLVEILHFVMERKMLLGIKERAETGSAAATLIRDELAADEQASAM